MSLNLIEATPARFASLIAGEVPEGAETLAPSEIAPAAVLEMLANLSARIAKVHCPNAWLIVADGCAVGMLSLVTEPAGRTATIGYGIAASHRSRGLASDAVAQLAALLRADLRIDAVLAETSPANPASQHVLRTNGFAETGRRIDPDDGELICWRLATP